jgi:hypothetical protein
VKTFRYDTSDFGENEEPVAGDTGGNAEDNGVPGGIADTAENADPGGTADAEVNGLPENNPWPDATVPEVTVPDTTPEAKPPDCDTVLADFKAPCDSRTTLSREDRSSTNLTGITTEPAE